MLSVENINYIKLGGPGQSMPVSILMLHGWNRSIEDLMPLGETLAEYATIYILDLPGFGKTPPPPEDGWDTTQYAELVYKFIEKEAIKSPILLGHSFGGRVSLRIAAKHPERISKIILIDSHGLRPVRTAYQHIRVFCIKRAAKIIKFLDNTFGTKIYSEKFSKRYGSPDYQNAGILKNTFVKTISEDQSKDVAKIKHPALLLWGSEDRETPPAMGKRFNKLLENSKLIILEGKDHSPFHGVGAHLCANHIINFIQS